MSTPSQPSNSVARRIAVRSLGVIRDTWLMVGVFVLLLVVAEGLYSLQRTLRDKMGSWSTQAASGPRPTHPVASLPWYPEFDREFSESQPLAWKPYVYFRRAKAYKGQYVNIDSARRRVTPQPLEPALPKARVFFFGGSTMWGSFLRDDHTIAAEAARRLQPLAGPGARIEVTNFGETGHTNTQGLLELILQLRNGNVPDVVVFYDGINDVFSQIQSGESGIGLNEGGRAAEFAMGRRLSYRGEDGLAKDLHTLTVLTAYEIQNLAFVKRLLRSARPSAAAPQPSIDSSARGIVRIYAENARIVEALGRVYGFTPVFVWQTTLHASDKRPTPYEARAFAQRERDPVEQRLSRVHRAVLPLMDSAMAGVAPGRFVNQGHLFTNDTLPVFSDIIGHNTEVAIPIIVDSLWTVLQRAVSAELAHPRAPEPQATMESSVRKPTLR